MYKSFNTCPDELSEFLLSIFFKDILQKNLLTTLPQVVT